MDAITAQRHEAANKSSYKEKPSQAFDRQIRAVLIGLLSFFEEPEDTEGRVCILLALGRTRGRLLCNMSPAQGGLLSEPADGWPWCQ